MCRYSGDETEGDPTRDPEVLFVAPQRRHRGHEAQNALLQIAAELLLPADRRHRRSQHVQGILEIRKKGAQKSIGAIRVELTAREQGRRAEAFRAEAIESVRAGQYQCRGHRRRGWWRQIQEVYDQKPYQI